jgi:hypothetical protein
MYTVYVYMYLIYMHSYISRYIYMYIYTRIYTYLYMFICFTGSNWASRQGLTDVIRELLKSRYIGSNGVVSTKNVRLSTSGQFLFFFLFYFF